MPDLDRFAAWLHTRRYAARTINTYRCYAARAADQVDLETATLEELHDWWATLPASPSTRNQARKALIAFYWSLGRRGLPAVELDTLPEPRRLPRPVPEATFVALLDAARLLGGIHEAAGVLLLTTGARISEARTASWDAFDLSSGWWRIIGKGSKRRGPKERVVPLCDRCATVLDRWRDVCGSATWVFPSAHGAWQGMISDGRMRSLVHDLAETAGVPRVTPHRLRHTFATLALRTAGIREVQELLGHADLSSTQIYTQVAPEQLRAVVESLPR